MRGSLRLRLFAAGAASILLALALAGFGLVLLFERHVERRVALELEAHLRQLIDGLGRAPDGTLDLLRPPAEPRFLEPLSGLYWQIGEEPPAASGTVLRSRSLWDTVLHLPADPLRSGEVHQHNISGPGGASLLAVERQVTLSASLGGGDVRAVVAVDRAELHAAGLAFARDLIPSLGDSAQSAPGGRPGSERRDSRMRCGRWPPNWITCSMHRTRHWPALARAPRTSRMG